MRESGSITSGEVAGEIRVEGPLRPTSRIGNTVLGSFKLIEVIGAGSFATAFLAEQLGTDRRAVVKITHANLVTGPSAAIVKRRFEDELRALTRVRHPNLVTVFLAGETTDGLPAIAMEHVDGNTMGELLECVTGPLSLEILDTCFLQIGSALRALHGAGIVHRDIAPSNIIIGADTTGHPQATLLDLGVAQLHDRALTSPRAVGTPRYIAPEQMLGKATSTSDMFALGAILWWALTGKELDENVSRLGLDRAWGEELEGAPNPRVDRPELPARLAEFVSRLLSFREEARPSAEEFVAEWPGLVGELRRGVPQVDPEFEGNTAPYQVGAGLTADVAGSAPGLENPLPPVPPPHPAAVGGVDTMFYSAMPERLEIPADARQDAQPSLGRAMRAALIDDNRFTRRFVESYLAKHGIDVSVVASIEEMSAERGQRPDVALVSGHLAGSEPCQLVRNIKSHVPGLPVILTAQSDIGEMWRTCGAREVVIVPSELTRLGELLEEVRANAAAVQEPEPEPEPEAHGIDVAVVLAIAAEEPLLMVETIEHFIGQFPEWLAQLSSAIERGDEAACAATCREIESAVVMVGARPLGHQATVIRSFAESGEIEMVQGFLDQMETDYGHVFQQLIKIRLEIETKNR